MPPITDAQTERVRGLVASIPLGRVATYGDIASAAGLSSPRIVAWIMRTDSADLPWHRVIRADGRPAPHLAAEQLARLAAEGVPAVDGRVTLAGADSVRHAFGQSVIRTSAAVRTKPENASAEDSGCR